MTLPRGNVVQQLLNQGANADFQNKGATTLITASYFGHVNVVKTLLSYEIKVNQQADAGSTALVATTFKGHQEIVKLLLNKGANPHIRNKRRANALITAQYAGHSKTVSLLRNFRSK